MQKCRSSVGIPRQNAKGGVPPLETAKHRNASDVKRKVVGRYAEGPFECQNT